jgi:hypothetical protein
VRVQSPSGGRLDELALLRQLASCPREPASVFGRERPVGGRSRSATWSEFDDVVTAAANEP